jgi:quercetin dioxygenase-like cupin family protein
MKQSTRLAATIRIAIVSLAGVAALFGAMAQPHASDQHHTVVSAEAVKWGPAPPSLPPGAQAAILLGSPAKEGPFVLRLKLPADFIVPPHRHSKDEFVTVISGKFVASHGEKVDRASLKFLPAGSFIHLPAGMPHYAVAEVESVVQINGMGPFDVTYLNPQDDPRKK